MIFSLNENKPWKKFNISYLLVDIYMYIVSLSKMISIFDSLFRRYANRPPTLPPGSTNPSSAGEETAPESMETPCSKLRYTEFGLSSRFS